MSETSKKEQNKKSKVIIAIGKTWAVIKFIVKVLIWPIKQFFKCLRILFIKFLLWILRPEDLRRMTIEARKDQYDADQGEFKKILNSELLRAERSKQVELAKKEAEIEMLQRTITEWEKRESALSDREYIVKLQVKENAKVALALFMHVKNIMMFVTKEAGEISGVVDSIETNKKQIESKLK